MNIFAQLVLNIIFLPFLENIFAHLLLKRPFLPFLVMNIFEPFGDDGLMVLLRFEMRCGMSESSKRSQIPIERSQIPLKVEKC